MKFFYLIHWLVLHSMKLFNLTSEIDMLKMLMIFSFLNRSAFGFLVSTSKSKNELQVVVFFSLRVIPRN